MEAATILVALEALLALIAWTCGARSPRLLALALLCATAPLEVYRADVGPANLSLFRISLLVALVTVVLERGRRLTAVVGKPLVAVATLLVAAMLASALIHSGNRDLAGIATGQALCVVAAAVLVSELARDLSLRQVVQLVVAGSILPMLAAIAQGLSGGVDEFQLPFHGSLPVPDGLEVSRQGLSSLGEVSQRLTGTFADPNHFGAYLIFVIALTGSLTVGQLSEGRARAPLEYAAMCVAASALLTATYSRSAWAGAAVAVVVGLAMALTSRDARAGLRRRWRWIAAVGLGAVVLAVPLAPTVGQRLDPDHAVNRRSDSYHHRTTRVAFEELRDNPIVGIGLADLGPRLGEGKRTSGAHSSYLTVGSELGLIGLLMMSLVILLALRTLWVALSGRWTARERLMIAGLLCAYVGFSFANVFYDLWWDDFHWVLLGVILALDLRTAAAAQPARLPTPAPIEPPRARTEV